MNRTATRLHKEPHELLTIREAALRLRVSEETIRRRCDDGTLGAVRLGSIRRVFASDVDLIFRRAAS